MPFSFINQLVLVFASFLGFCLPCWKVPRQALQFITTLSRTGHHFPHPFWHFSSLAFGFTESSQLKSLVETVAFQSPKFYLCREAGANMVVFPGASGPYGATKSQKGRRARVQTQPPFAVDKEATGESSHLPMTHRSPRAFFLR